MNVSFEKEVSNFIKSVSSEIASELIDTETNVEYLENICEKCGKDCTLFGYLCRCNNLYCKKHKYPEKHKCKFDFYQSRKDKIMRENPIVRNTSISKI